MDRRADIERWFAARGVPQLIEGYTTEQRMDSRAVPYIAGWIVLGTVLLWGRRPSLSLTEQALGMAFVIGASVAVLALYLWWRGRPPFRTGVRLDPLDIGLIGLVPAVAAAILHGSPTIVVGIGGSVLLGVGIIYLFTAFGLFELGIWAIRHLRAQLSQIATLVSRTMPVLLILVVFLLFASELWQAAHTLGGADLAAVLALLLVVATILVVTSARTEIGAIEANRAWATITPLLADTPAGSLATELATREVPGRMGWRERANLVLLMLLSQLVQSLFVALLVLVFLVALGVLAIPASVQATWVGEPVRALLGFELLGEPRLVSVELLITAGLLGGVSALYFTGLALTDTAFRAEFHASVVGDVEQIMAVHAAYLASAEDTRGN
jgi:hypothetical protein